MDEFEGANASPTPRRGRPVGWRKPEGRKRNRSVALHDATWARLDAIAAAQGRSPAEVLERLIQAAPLPTVMAPPEGATLWHRICDMIGHDQVDGEDARLCADDWQAWVEAGHGTEADVIRLWRDGVRWPPAAGSQT